MAAFILDGKYVASKKRAFIQQSVEMGIQQGLRAPGLAVILVGDDPASCVYVKHKRNACIDTGIASFMHSLPLNTTEHELLALIDTLNNTPEVDGILVQLPLPSHINTTTIIERISPQKDVDGFHPYNLGRLAQKTPTLRPCTPYGVIKLLEYYQRPIEGLHAVVIGASNIVGRPMALEFLLARATVSICHSATLNLEPFVRSADIIVVCAGVMDIIDPAWLNKKQVLIDIGIHRLPNGSLRGDIDFAVAKNHVGWITPVPGGIGPMTVCMLLQNTLFAATHFRSILSQSNSSSNSPS